MTENIWKNPDLAENFLQKSRYFLSIFAFINSTGKSIIDTERYTYSVIWKLTNLGVNFCLGVKTIIYGSNMIIYKS